MYQIIDDFRKLRYVLAVVAVAIVAIYCVNLPTVSAYCAGCWRMVADITVAELRNSTVLLPLNSFTVVLEVRVSDVNDTFARVDVYGDEYLMISLLVHKSSNDAWVNGTVHIGFNPFFVFYPRYPPTNTVKARYLGYEVTVSYLSKYGYSVADVSGVREYVLTDLCTVSSSKEFTTFVPYQYVVANGTLVPKYATVKVPLLHLVYKAGYPVTLTTVIPADLLCKHFRLKHGIGEGSYVILNAYVPPDFTEEVKFLESVHVSLPLRILLLKYITYVVVAALVIIAVALYMLLRRSTHA